MYRVTKLSKLGLETGTTRQFKYVSKNLHGDRKDVLTFYQLEV